MPLDIDRIDSNINCKIIFSKTVELLSAVHLLADKKHHAFLPEWSRKVIEGLTPRGKETLDLISELHFPALELYDFILKDEIYQDVALLLDWILQAPVLEFVYTALNGEIDRVKIEEAWKDPKDFHNIIEGLSIAASGSERVLQAIVYDTENYRRDLVELIREIEHQGIEEVTDSLGEQYEEAMENVRARLVHKNPIELSEEIKGSKVSSRKEYKEYIFVPSYFLHHHNIISYGGERFMLVYNININNTDISEEAERLANLLKVLSEKSRLEILRQLKRRTTYGKVLSSRLKLTTATISRHLEQLRAINLIREVKADNVKYFKVNSEELDKLLEDIKKFVNGL